MQIVLTTGGRAQELDVVVHDPDATVADLVAVLAGGDPHLSLEAEGVVLPGDRRLDRAGIRTGSPIRLVTDLPSPAPTGPRPGASPGPHDGGHTGVTELAVVGGLDAGARARLDAGTWPLGRDTPGLALDHDTVSSHHATLEVGPDGATTLTDQGSLNGTWVAGSVVTDPTDLDPGQVARVGALQIATRAPVDDDRPVGMATGPGRGGATVPFNRPPRPAPTAPPDPLDTPAAPREHSGPSAIGIMSILAPLGFGAAMVAITGRLAFALFVLLSPVVIIGTAIDSRRRGRKARRRDAARFQAQVEELATRLVEAVDEERSRRTDEIPDPAELLRRIEAPSVRLWERRPGHRDWLHLRAGIGSDAWTPAIHGDRRSQPEEVRDVVRAASHLDDAPVLIDLDRGGVVGVVGPRPAALAVARSLVVQACTLHGPADLPALIMAAPDHADAWDWAKWLPHVLDPGGSGHRLITTRADAAESRCRVLLEAAEADRTTRRGEADDLGRPTPTTLLVIDDETLTEGRRAPVRSLLRGAAGRVSGIVVARSEDRLPAVCTTVVDVADGDGPARVHHVRDGILVEEVLACGVSDTTARRAARGLARFDDPELDVAGAGLPSVVALLPLLGVDEPTARAVADRWSAAGADPDLIAPVGVSEDGVLALDLVRDGPHGLVAGTTGAGKSELLRSLVAALATGSSPDHLTFVLIDFKGGSAFDRCARLPHTVGLVTDLDAHLAERALRCLDAELRHRERILRAAGATDLTAYRRLGEGGRPPLPRLVVVVDEFATLKAELPDFVESLVGVAQRGRSLGVHLVLATQRPSGAVSENIRANTNLRIALRVQDGSDSNDVIDVPDAARIGRSQPGRALARLGPGEVIPLQTALSTGVSPHDAGPIDVRPFRLRGAGADPASRTERTAGPSDLALLVDACRGAHLASGRPSPRRPWPDPLPEAVDLARVRDLAPSPGPFGGVGGEIAFTLADVPDRQAQVPAGWVPAEGNLLLVGLPGSGTTTALTSVAVAAARGASPDDLHLYGVDFGTGDLDVLHALPHVGAVVPAHDRERQARLMAWLRTELDRRRGLRDPRSTEPRVLALVDGVGPFLAAWDEAVSPVLDGFARAFAEGPELGIHMAVTADRAVTLPAPLRGLVRQVLLFRLGDDLDYAQVGFGPADLPEFVPGRALHGARHLEVQVARPADGFGTEVERIAIRHDPPRRAPVPVTSLPRAVPVSALHTATEVTAVPRHLPVGIGEATLSPSGFTLYPGEHALVAGPARSGRSTTLAVAAEVAAAAGWSTAVIAAPRSPLGARGDLGPVLGSADLARTLPVLLQEHAGGRLLIVVDDIELVDPDGAVMHGVLERDDIVVVGAGRADTLRGLYSHWARALRQSRSGLLLTPDVDLDGDLLGARLPRRSTTSVTPGRGYLCTGGEVELVQVAQPGVGDTKVPVPDALRKI